MRRVLFLIIAISLTVSFSGCQKGDLSDESTALSPTGESTSNELTAPAAGTDLSVDEIVSLYNDAISNASSVTRLYSHAEYKNFTLSNDAFEAAAKSALDKVIKNNEAEFTTVQRSEIEEILPRPCLDKSAIKKYEVSDGRITLYLHDIDNPADEGCIKLYPLSFMTDMLKNYNISIDNADMSYTDCRIDFIVENKAVTELSYSWSVNAEGSFELLFKTQSFGIDICVGESFKIQV